MAAKVLAKIGRGITEIYGTNVYRKLLTSCDTSVEIRTGTQPGELRWLVNSTIGGEKKWSPL